MITIYVNDDFKRNTNTHTDTKNNTIDHTNNNTTNNTNHNYHSNINTNRSCMMQMRPLIQRLGPKGPSPTEWEPPDTSILVHSIITMA